MTGRFPPGSAPTRRAGARNLSMARMHLFDTETGAAIAARPSGRGSRGMQRRKREMKKDPVGGFGSRSRYARHDRHRSCPDDLAHLHGRPAAAGRHAPDRRRIREAQPEREGRGRSGRRHVRQQQQYLNTVLASRDSSLDVVLIDVIRPAQWAAAQWAEPLDSYLGADKDKIMARYLPAYREANTVERQGHLAALFRGRAVPLLPQGPAREARRQPPKTWAEVKAAAQKIMQAEQPEPARVRGPRARRSKGRCAPSAVPLWGAGVP